MIKTFGQAIKEARQAKGYSQKDVGDFAGITKSHVSHAEKGDLKYQPKADVIYAIASFLELDELELCLSAGRIPLKYLPTLQENAKAVADLLKDLSNSRR
jgi:transcriptional regulator with XRE-family HTH domain